MDALNIADNLTYSEQIAERTVYISVHNTQ